MTDWRPTSGEDVARRRAALLERARRYFSEQDVLAVDTPAINRFAASDPNTESLVVQNRSGKQYFLHTSPEFFMKRLLAAGYPDIYSICRVFRDGESGRHHVPEFTMLEWYRLGFDLEAIIDDTTRFIATCLGASELIDNVVQYEYADAFLEFADIDVFRATAGELSRRCTDDKSLQVAIGEDRDAGLDLLLSTVVAPQFARDRLTVLRHYPATQASLARICPDDDRRADRFEVFYGEMELANGYVELTDAAEQQQRFDTDLQTRRRAARVDNPWDVTLLAALESGLPDCAGVAVGLERLQMILDKTDDIRNVLTFVPGNVDG